MNKPAETLLKLKAESIEDIEVLSALLQDALVPSGGILHDLKTGSFSLLLYRLNQEALCQASSQFSRRKSFLEIFDITHLQCQYIDPSDPFDPLVLLAFSYKNGAFEFTFSGHKKLRALSAQSPVFLTDTEVSWPTFFEPTHETPITTHDTPIN